MRTCEIKLTRGLVTLVDEDDYDRFGGLKWYAHSNSATATNGRGERYFVAARRTTIECAPQRTQFLHREIMAAPRGMVIDHVNHDPLDNRKINLRLCSHAENLMNQKPQKGRTSRYKGVSWVEANRKWRADIRLQGKQHYLGYFEHEEHAALEYNRAAIQLFGPFAKLNEVSDAG